MAQSSFPFEGIDTTETQYSQLFRTFQDSVNGTYGGTELTVSVGTGLAVDVALGQAMVRGHFYVSTATESLSLTTADATNPRLDLVVLRLDPVANSIVLAVKDGTPAGSPTAPALVQTDAGTYEIALATVLVPATSGVPTTITDKRQFMGSRISLWSDDTRPTTVFPHVGFNTTGGTFEGYDPALASWGPIGGGGGVTVSATAPTSPDDGDLWLDSTDGSMYVYYTDPGGANAQWIGAVSRSGGILQVVSTTKTDVFSASLATAAFTEITGLTATITPRSTSSKILAMVNVYGGNGVANRYASFALKLQRGSTDIGLGDADGSKTRVTAHTQDSMNSDGNADTLTFQYLDSPSTTASTTYSVEIGNVMSSTATGTFYVNRNSGTNDNNRVARPASTITLMEVAG